MDLFWLSDRSDMTIRPSLISSLPSVWLQLRWEYMHIMQISDDQCYIIILMQANRHVCSTYVWMNQFSFF